MSTSTFDAFGPLDDLIQVIYQASHRFIFLSRVEFDEPDPAWNVHVGLADIGRWWKGRWIKEDLDESLGKGVSDQMIEAFVDNIERAVTQGHLYVEGMVGTEPGPEMKISFDPHSKKPLLVPLSERSPHDAILFVTNEFFQLGLNAQKRKCKLNPPTFQTFASAPVTVTRQRHRESPPPSTPLKKTRMASTSPSSPPTLPKTRSYKTQSRKPLEKEVKANVPEPSGTETGTGKAKVKAAPAKRARKIQKMVFASDDE